MSWISRAGPATFAVVLAVSLVGFALATGAVGLGGGHAVWYAARASGLTAYALATASVLFGLASATRAGNPKPGLGVVTDTHRALSLLTLLAIGGHVLFLALDSYADFGPLDLFVPFGSWYRPVWTGLGVLAAYLAVAVYVSFYFRTRVGYRAWRFFHYAAFAVFGLGTVHGVLTGTDSGTVWASTVYAGAIASVALMGAYRLTRGSGHKPAWAFNESSGNSGAARAVLATAVLFAALVLPLWVMTRATADTPSSIQSTASLDAGGFSARRGAEDAGEVGDRQRDRQREREPEEEREED